MKEIFLTQGKSASVDDADYERIMCYKWHASKYKNRWYAQTMIRCEDGKRRKLGMHNLISSAKYVDHIDGNGLNNQSGNLRQCSHSQNMRNRLKAATSFQSSKFKGVSWDAPSGKWMVQVKFNNERFVCRCKDEVLAAKIYNAVALHWHEEFANLNIV